MGKHTLHDIPRAVLDDMLRQDQPTDQVAPVERAYPLRPRPYVDRTPSEWFEQQEEPTVKTLKPPPADPEVWPSADPEGEDSQYLDDMAHDNDERWEELDEELGQEPSWLQRRRSFILIVVCAVVFGAVNAFAFDLLFTNDEPEVRTVTEKVEVMPESCLQALAEAEKGYRLVGDYNTNELQPLPTSAGGFHLFLPEAEDNDHDMGHYEKLRQYDKDLKANRQDFMTAVKACK